MAQVILSEVSKVYPNGAKAVDGFSLDIADGEFVVFVGPSGCGKSTTLRLIAGLEEDFSGTISIDGRIVNNVPPAQRDIAMVFQNYALYPHMTVHANMAMALKLKGVARAKADAKVREVAAMLEVNHLLDRKPGQLSGGQRQRVALGRAIVREPKAFLFDEPLSNLDARLRVSTRAEIKALHQRLRTTSVYVTHDQEEAMTLGDRVVVMANGRIQQAAHPMEVYRRPANRFVAGFVGSPAMNFFDGVIGPGGVFIERGQSGASLELPAGMPPLAAGATITLGVRPGHLDLCERGVGEPGVITAAVRAIEPLGEQADVHATTLAGTPIVARISLERRVPVAGETVHLRAPRDRVLVFEPGPFGRNLLLNQLP